MTLHCNAANTRNGDKIAEVASASGYGFTVICNVALLLSFYQQSYKYRKHMHGQTTDKALLTLEIFTIIVTVAFIFDSSYYTVYHILGYYDCNILDYQTDSQAVHTDSELSKQLSLIIIQFIQLIEVFFFQISIVYRLYVVLHGSIYSISNHVLSLLGFAIFISLSSNIFYLMDYNFEFINNYNSDISVIVFFISMTVSSLIPIFVSMLFSNRFFKLILTIRGTLVQNGRISQYEYLPSQTFNMNKIGQNIHRSQSGKYSQSIVSLNSSFYTSLDTSLTGGGGTNVITSHMYTHKNDPDCDSNKYNGKQMGILIEEEQESKHVQKSLSKVGQIEKQENQKNIPDKKQVTPSKNNADTMILSWKNSGGGASMIATINDDDNYNDMGMTKKNEMKMKNDHDDGDDNGFDFDSLLTSRQTELLGIMSKQTILAFFECIFFVFYVVIYVIKVIILDYNNVDADSGSNSVTKSNIYVILFSIVDCGTNLAPPLCLYLSFVYTGDYYYRLCIKCDEWSNNWHQKLVSRKLIDIYTSDKNLIMNHGAEQLLSLQPTVGDAE